MLLPLLCLLLLSTQLSVTLVVKSVLLLLLGPSNTSDMLRNVTSVNSSNSSNTEQYILGTYDLESSTNFDSYLEEMGVSYFLRQLAQLAQPRVTFSVECEEENMVDSKHGDTENTEDTDHSDIALASAGCVWSIHTDAGVKIHDIAFTLGEEVMDITMDGREVTSKYTMSKANTLIEETMGKTSNTTLTRNFFSDGMEVIMQVNDVTAQSVFKRKTA